MPDKAWKQAERRIAALLGGRRIPVTGEREGADVLVGPPGAEVFAVQVKQRRGMPTYLHDWLRGIRVAADRHGPQCTGIVVWREPRGGHGRGDEDAAVVVLSLRDWRALHGDGR